MLVSLGLDRHVEDLLPVRLSLLASTYEEFALPDQRVSTCYGVVMSGCIWTPPDCKRVWQTLVQGSQLLTYIRLLYAA